jgi:5-methylcytosine-specific restriction endonuclease McrA
MTLRPCAGCGTPSPSTRCPDCTASLPPRFRFDAYANRSWRWRQLSRRLRRDCPFCEVCGSGEDLTVDHVLPLSQGGRQYDRRNLRVLCRRCHGEVRPP